MRIKTAPLDFVFLLLIIAFSFISFYFSTKSNGKTVMVEANGKSYRYSLSKNGTYSVDGALGKTTFQIKDSKVHIIDSPCPTKSCVHQGWTSPIVCLPNSVIITIENYGDFDAVSE